MRANLPGPPRFLNVLYYLEMRNTSADIPVELKNCRADLDRIDDELIQLLARRLEVGLRAARIKREAGMPIVDPEREERVIAQAREWAAQAGLSEDEVAEIVTRIVALSAGAQLRYTNTNQLDQNDT